MLFEFDLGGIERQRKTIIIVSLEGTQKTKKKLDIIASSSSLEYTLVTNLGRTLVPLFLVSIWKMVIAEYPKRPVESSPGDRVSGRSGTGMMSCK